MRKACTKTGVVKLVQMNAAENTSKIRFKTHICAITCGYMVTTIYVEASKEESVILKL